jgi:hypothetical protein
VINDMSTNCLQFCAMEFRYVRSIPKKLVSASQVSHLGRSVALI